MRRRLVLATTAALLFGCAGVAKTSYELGTGDANYDAVKAATQTCEGEGGVVRLRSGYDARQLASFECVGARVK